MAIAVITAAYNAAEYIEKCISSVQAQSYTDWKMYIINDGSSDNTWHILQTFTLSDSRIKCFNTPNQGVFCARKKAIDLVENCKYITFLDSDDYFNDDQLFERSIKTMTAHDIDCLCFNYLHNGEPGFKDNSEIIWNSPKQAISDMLSQRHIDGNMPYCIYRYDIVKENFIAYKYNNDDYLNKYDILASSKKVAYKPWVAYFYTTNPNSQTHRLLRENDYLYYDHVYIFIENILKKYPDLTQECEYFKSLVLLWLMTQICKDSSKNRWGYYKRIRREFKNNRFVIYKNPLFSLRDKFTCFTIHIHIFRPLYYLYHALKRH